MPIRKPEIVEIDVTVTPPQNAVYPCNVSFDLSGGKTGKVTCSTKGGKYWVEFKNKKQGGGPADPVANGYIILFNIDDPDGTGCKFINDPDEAMWVQDISVCPTSQCYWPEFTAIAVLNDGATLMVYNANSYEQNFAFTLRFTIPGCGVIEFDPVGNNQNGYD